MSNPTSPLDLGTLPVSKLLKQYAFPAIVAMTASSLYNMVDSIFIGHGVGPLAISGLALTFPFVNLSAAFRGHGRNRGIHFNIRTIGTTGLQSRTRHLRQRGHP